MVKKRRQRPLPIPPRPQRRPWSRDFRLQVAVVAGFVLLLAFLGGIIGFGFFQDWYEENVERPNSKALEVGETTFDLDYFARRMKLMIADYGLQQQPEQASLVVSLLANTLGSEELLRQRAPVDLGVSITPEEMELAISDRLGLTVSDPEAFAAALEEELKRIDLSDEEYRRMVEADLLAIKVQQVLSFSRHALQKQLGRHNRFVGPGEQAAALSQDPGGKGGGGDNRRLLRGHGDIELDSVD